MINWSLKFGQQLMNIVIIDLSSENVLDLSCILRYREKWPSQLPKAQCDIFR